MQIDINPAKLKKDARVWAALVVILGGANLGDLVQFAGDLFDGNESIQAEAKARHAADSAIIVRLEKIEITVEDGAKTTDQIGRGVLTIQEYMLQLPQVQRFDRQRQREDSLKRERERLRRSLFDREATRGMMLDRRILQ